MTKAIRDPAPLPDTYRAGAAAFKARSLTGAIATDVVIIGGGLTGLSTALHARDAGLSAVVLEAKTIGSGGSGRAFGQIVPYAKHGYGHVLSHFGPDYGNRLVDALGAAPNLVFDLVRKHAIACEAQETGLIFAAHNAASAAGLEKRTRFYAARGINMQMFDAAGAERLIGSRYYRVAQLDPRGGTLNPLAYTRGLAIAAQREGAELFENSRALRIFRQGADWIVETEAGRATGRFVVVATDAYTDDLWPGLRKSLIPLRAYQIASEPLSDNQLRDILPGGQAITDTRRLYSGIRKRGDGRLHLSVDGPAFSNDGHASIAMARKRVRDVFPQLGELDWPDEVAGWVGMSMDQYPHMHRLDDNVFAAIGLSGRGIAFGTLLGKEVVKRLIGRPEHEMVLPVTPLAPIGVRPFARPLVGALINLYRALDFIELKSGYVGHS